MMDLRIRDRVKIGTDPMIGRIQTISHGVAVVKWADGSILPHVIKDLKLYDRPTNLSEIGF